MNNPTSIISADARVRRKRRQTGSTSTPPAALTLVAAEYLEDGPKVRLTFDRAIDIAGMVGSQIVVDDAGNLGLRFQATGGATVESPTTVLLALVEIGEATGIGTTLTAGAGNGIVAADDAGAWAGATDLELPFP